MSDDKFEIGSVVYLKIGSPAMTVDSLPEAGSVHTQWFDGELRLQYGKFSTESIFIETPALKYMRMQRANNMKVFMGNGGVPEVVSHDVGRRDSQAKEH